MDSLVGVFSPSRAEARQESRARAAMYQRYAAAKVDEYGPAGLGALDRNPNHLIGDRAAVLRARTRKLVRDFSLFARAVNAVVALTVGPGFSFQYKLRDQDGAPARALNAQVEEAWAEWSEECDLAGEITFPEFEALARRQQVEVGEALAVMPLDNAAAGIPLRLQMFEPDFLSGWGARPAGEVDIIQGLEVDRRTGKVLAGWFENPLRPLESKRIERADMVHYFQRLRPGQLRGVTPLAPAVLAAMDLGEYVGAEIEGAMLAARVFAVAESANPAQYAQARANSTISDSEGKVKTKVRDIGRHITEIIKPGEKFTLTSPNRPGAQFEPTANFLTRLIAVAADLSFELVSGNYNGLSFSNQKGVRADLIMLALPAQQTMIRRWHMPIFRRWLDVAHLCGRLHLPNYWQLRRMYWRQVRWGLPRIASTDILRETKALMDQIKAGLISPQEILASMGLDPEDTLKGIAEFQDLAADLNVTLDWAKASTGLKQNPASLGAPDSEA